MFSLSILSFSFSTHTHIHAHTITVLRTVAAVVVFIISLTSHLSFLSPLRFLLLSFTFGHCLNRFAGHGSMESNKHFYVVFYFQLMIIARFVYFSLMLLFKISLEDMKNEMQYKIFTINSFQKKFPCSQILHRNAWANSLINNIIFKMRCWLICYSGHIYCGHSSFICLYSLCFKSIAKYFLYSECKNAYVEREREKKENIFYFFKCAYLRKVISWTFKLFRTLFWCWKKYWNRSKMAFNVWC